jgi:hypothetical protein
MPDFHVHSYQELSAIHAEAVKPLFRSVAASALWYAQMLRQIYSVIEPEDDWATLVSSGDYLCPFCQAHGPLNDLSWHDETCPYLWSARLSGEVTDG